LSLWLLGVLKSVVRILLRVLSGSVGLENFSKVNETRFANSMLSLANFTGFAVVGELEAEAVLRLSRSKSFNMSTPENIIQDRTSRSATVLRSMAPVIIAKD
jgi:hypothetical protein